MSTDSCAVRSRARQGRGTLLRLAASAVLLAAGAVGAQTAPYQAPQRLDIGTGLGQHELPKGGVFEPRAELALQYAANLELAADGEPQVDQAGVELVPGFYASYSTPAVVAAMDYSLVGRAWEDSDYNDLSHRLAANGQWSAVPEWFSLRGRASYDDTVIDSRAGANYGGLGIFGSSNLAEVATASVTPVLQHRFNVFEFGADYSYGRTWYLDAGKGQPVAGFVDQQDSTDQAASVRFGTARTGSKLSAQASYQWQKSEFETALPYQYERAGLDVGLRIARSLWLVGDVGQESDLDVSTTEGGLDSGFWSAGLRWEPNERSSAELRYGEQFFGSSYSVRVEHRARRLEFFASYAEQPTVETRLLSLGEFDPGQLPPGSPDVGLGFLTSEPYVARDARAGIVLQGSRTTLRITGGQFERDYLRARQYDQTDTTGSLGVTRQLASNLSADATVTYTDYERVFASVDPLPPVRTDDYDTQAILRLNRRSGDRLTLTGETGYLQRAGDDPYDGWWVALRARYTP